MVTYSLILTLPKREQISLAESYVLKQKCVRRGSINFWEYLCVAFRVTHSTSFEHSSDESSMFDC